MNKVQTLLLPAAFLLLGLAGCSTRQMHDGLQAGARNACQPYPEPDRSRCLSANDRDYERYQRERDQIQRK